MATAELTLVLSGHLRRPQSADLRPFWQGFIELQKRLPMGKPIRQIVAHSWDPDLASLARAVYAPQVERHEHQAFFYSEVMREIAPTDRFEQGLDRLTSSWNRDSLQLVLGKVRSRSRAVELMDELPSHQGQVLITRWDLGPTDGEQVNQLVADATLPEDYLYLAYSSEVDEGYADIWVLAPWPDARRFGRLEAFVLDSLAGRNRYLELFSESGWPRARVKKRFEVWWSQPVGHRVRVLASKLVLGAQKAAREGALPERIVRRLTRPLQRFLSQPPVTAENSCVPGFEAQPPVFPAFQALNVHALLKYFILLEGLRKRVRFLTPEDFDIFPQSGQMINPQPVVLFVHEVDDASMARLLDESPLPLAAVYQMGAQNVRQHLPDGQVGWRMIKLCAAGSTPRDLMACAVDAELHRENGLLPVLVMPTIERYLGCSDWLYMNALAKYLAWSHTGYVGLASSRAGKPHLDFPNFQLVQGGGAFSLRMAAGTVNGIRAVLDVVDVDLNEASDRADRMLLEFPVVVKDGGLF